MFQSSLSKINLAIFFLLLVSLGIVYFSEPTDAATKTIHIIAGFFALLFPVGWLSCSLLFPKREQISLLSRMLVSVALSIALNNLGLLILFYLHLLPLTKQTNVFLLFTFGTIFFITQLVVEWREKNGER